MSEEICRTKCWEAGKVFKLKHLLDERETSLPKPEAQSQRKSTAKVKKRLKLVEVTEKDEKG